MFRKISVWSFVSFILSLLLTIGSTTVFAACGLKDDGTWMRCHSAQTMITALSAVLTAVILLQTFLPHKALKVLLNIVSIIGCIVIFLIPGTLMPMCMMHTMRCYTVMQPFVRIIVVLIAALTLISTTQEIRKKR